MPKTHKVRAWLITWESVGDHASRDIKPVAVLDPRMSGRRVRELVEFLYTCQRYTLREQVRCMLKKKENPYRAQFINAHQA